MNIPKDTILMISGVSCVGKTTTAYEIIKKYTVFRRVSEADIVRTVIRTSYEHITEIFEPSINLVNEYDTLFKSISNNDFATTKLQSKQLLPYIKEIILRQQRRKIPTIIEGAGIVPSTYFPDNKPLKWLTDHVIFVNLYLASEEEHVIRRQSRSEERDYNEDIRKTQELILRFRKEKNELLNEEALMLHQLYNNVFSLDVSNASSSKVADMIMKCIYNYFND